MSEKDSIEYSIERIMFPIVKLLIDCGVTHSYFASVTKRTFVKVAAQKLDEEEVKQRSEIPGLIAGMIEERSDRPGSPDVPLSAEQMAEMELQLLQSSQYVTLVRQLLKRFGVSDLSVATVVDRLPQPVKRSDSRVAMMTGVPRREVGSLLQASGPDSGADSQWYSHRCMKILNKWFSDPDYLDTAGLPIPLVVSNQDMKRKGAGVSFELMVASVAKELSHSLVLSELEAAGCVVVEGNSVKAVKKRFQRQGISPDVLVDAADHFFALGMSLNARLREGSASTMMEGMVTELNPSLEERNLILNALRKRAETFLNSGISTMADSGKDATPDSRTSDQRVGLGVFVFEGDDMADSRYFAEMPGAREETGN